MATNIKVGCHVALGGRPYLEDYLVVVSNFNEFIDAPDEVRRSFFAVFDGHGGSLAADFLSRQFHLELAKRKELKTDPQLALDLCWREMDQKLLNELTRTKSNKKGAVDLNDGSTGTVCLIVGNQMYVTNCGDSSAYISYGTGAPQLLTEMHNSESKAEVDRCLAAGGQFRSQSSGGIIIAVCSFCFPIAAPKPRVYPGGLLVTRSFGDFHSKLPQRGGVSGVVVPDHGAILSLPLTSTAAVASTAQEPPAPASASAPKNPLSLLNRRRQRLVLVLRRLYSRQRRRVGRASGDDRVQVRA